MSSACAVRVELHSQEPTGDLPIDAIHACFPPQRGDFSLLAVSSFRLPFQVKKKTKGEEDEKKKNSPTSSMTHKKISQRNTQTRIGKNRHIPQCPPLKARQGKAMGELLTSPEPIRVHSTGL